jgi:hypothetical protein
MNSIRDERRCCHGPRCYFDAAPFDTASSGQRVPIPDAASSIRFDRYLFIIIILLCVGAQFVMNGR